MINKDALNDLNEMVNKMDKALEFYRSGAKVAKELNVELPVCLKNKIAGLAALANICEKVHYYKSNKADVLFEWFTLKAKPTVEETMVADRLLNEYRKLKFDVGDVEYFIPDELLYRE